MYTGSADGRPMGSIDDLTDESVQSCQPPMRSSLRRASLGSPSDSVDSGSPAPVIARRVSFGERPAEQYRRKWSGPLAELHREFSAAGLLPVCDDCCSEASGSDEPHSTSSATPALQFIRTGR